MHRKYIMKLCSLSAQKKEKYEKSRCQQADANAASATDHGQNMAMMLSINRLRLINLFINLKGYEVTFLFFSCY